MKAGATAAPDRSKSRSAVAVQLGVRDDVADDRAREPGRVRRAVLGGAAEVVARHVLDAVAEVPLASAAPVRDGRLHADRPERVEGRAVRRGPAARAPYDVAVVFRRRPGPFELK